MTCDHPEHFKLGPSEADKERWHKEGMARFERDLQAALDNSGKPATGNGLSVDDWVKPRKKGVYVGAPACFALELACQHINAAFGGHGCYLVGSALERPDWRDIDVRFIMSDDEFEALFPGTLKDGIWEFDQRWILLTISISEHLRSVTGLPVDFQFQPRTHANERHKGPRNALGLRFSKEQSE